jgi:hypothetical protein
VHAVQARHDQRDARAARCGSDEDDERGGGRRERERGGRRDRGEGQERGKRAVARGGVERGGGGGEARAGEDGDRVLDEESQDADDEADGEGDGPLRDARGVATGAPEAAMRRAETERGGRESSESTRTARERSLEDLARRERGGGDDGRAPSGAPLVIDHLVVQRLEVAEFLAPGGASSAFDVRVGVAAARVGESSSAPEEPPRRMRKRASLGLEVSRGGEGRLASIASHLYTD